MNPELGIEEWAEVTTRGRMVFNYNVHPGPIILVGWQLARVVPLQVNTDITEKAFFWNSKIDPLRETLRMDLAELPDWRRAQKHLRKVLNHCMRPNIPHGTGELAHLGDVNFVARMVQTDIPAAIWFTRGNICVSLSSAGEKVIDVSAVALAIDALLQQPLGKPEAAWTSAPLTAALKAGEPHVLIESLPGAAPRGQWLQIFAPDGELSRKDDALIYVAAAEGQKKIDVFVAVKP